jgi:hypothetical protein
VYADLQPDLIPPSFDGALGCNYRLFKFGYFDELGGVASGERSFCQQVVLGDSRTPIDRPSFKNTLSAGDRAMLALAFFLAHLEREPDRAVA